MQQATLIANQKYNQRTLTNIDKLITHWEERLARANTTLRTAKALHMLSDLREARQQFLDAHPNLNPDKERPNGDN